MSRVPSPSPYDPPMADQVSYSDAGVDYETLDAGKRLAVAEALATSGLLAGRGGRALDSSRGEPAFVFELDERTLALVVEGLGTKSIIARQVLEEGFGDGPEAGAGARARAEAGGEGWVREDPAGGWFANVAYDAVAAIVNDLCCVGALPLVVNAYFATGSSQWYRAPARARELVEGWRRACEDAGCAWGGGESPSLPGLLDEREIELAGAAVGAVPPGRAAILGQDLAPGNEIVLVASTGLHANGASLARLVASRLPDGYATVLAAGERGAAGDDVAGGECGARVGGDDVAGGERPAGAAGETTLGRALLEPSAMYVGLVARLLALELPVTYLSHITGHGLLKLMRRPQSLRYRVHELGPVPEVLAFLVAEAGLDARAAYSTFNMGAGYAVYCAAGAGAAVVEAAAAVGLRAWVAGVVEEGPREVVLEPVELRYRGEELELGG